MQYHIQPLSLDKFGDPLHPFPAFTASVANLRPTSRGTLKLKSADPAAAPAIQPNYLATPEDRRVAAQSIRITRAIVRAAGACSPIAPVEYLPGAQVRDDDEAALEKAAGDIGTTIFHPVGTARMGRADDARAVVDARLRVIGLERPARDRRLGDAVDHLRQHQLADHDDRRERRGDDAGGREALTCHARAWPAHPAEGGSAVRPLSGWPGQARP